MSPRTTLPARRLGMVFAIGTALLAAPVHALVEGASPTDRDASVSRR